MAISFVFRLCELLPFTILCIYRGVRRFALYILLNQPDHTLIFTVGFYNHFANSMSGQETYNFMTVKHQNLDEDITQISLTCTLNIAMYALMKVRINDRNVQA
jgi:hypothetical protein